MLTRGHAESGGRQKVEKAPWKDILTSGPVFGVVAGHLASNWGLYQLNTLMPTYLNDVLKVDIKTNGWLTAMPFVLQSIILFVGSLATDYVRRKGVLTTIEVRKLNTALGLLVPAATVMMASYSGCLVWLAVTFFAISLSFNNLTVPGCKTAMLDFAPRYSGLIMGVSNFVANFAGFLAPQTTGRLARASNTVAGWRTAFWITAIIYIPGFLMFQIFGTDELQPWAKGPQEGNAATASTVVVEEPDRRKDLSATESS